ncbi:uncharacterized protein METZ01_LOCUS364107, partial [marine metagenome]
MFRVIFPFFLFVGFVLPPRAMATDESNSPSVTETVDDTAQLDETRNRFPEILRDAKLL